MSANRQIKRWFLVILTVWVTLLGVPLQKETAHASTDSNLNSIEFANNMFVAVGTNGKIITSTDGSNWITRNSGVVSTLNQVVYLNGQFFAVGMGSAILTSPDGETWTQRAGNVDTIDIRTVSYGNGIYVALANDGSIFTSSNGVEWQYSEVREFYGRYLHKVVFNGNKFIAITFDGKAESSNGKQWSVYSNANFDKLRSIAVGDGKQVGVGTEGNMHFNNSPYRSGTSSTLNSVKFINGYFIAVGSNGTVITSLDGPNWTLHAGAADAQDDLTDLAYGNGVFVAVGNNDLVKRLQLSDAAPIAMDGTISTTENRPVSDTLKVSNPNSISLRQFAVASQPQHGSLTLKEDGGYTYVPAPAYAGTDSFTFTASNGVTTSPPAKISITVIPVAKAPQASLPSGSSVSPKEIITLKSDTPGATIYYTVDFSAPSRSSKQGSNVQLDASKGSMVTIKAFSVKEGMADSEIVTFTYNVANNAATPEGYPVSGSEVVNNSEIMLRSETTTAKIYYTLDGTTPTLSSKTSGSFLAHIALSGKPGEVITVKAMAAQPGMTNSEVSTFKYTIISESVLDEVAKVTGVESGGSYATEKVITFNKGTATLNGMPFRSGEKVSKEGAYTLDVKIEQSRRSLTLYFSIDKTPPVVNGVKQGGVYQTPVNISFNEGTATLNGKPLYTGAFIEEPGAYTVVVTDAAGNRTALSFELESPDAVVKGVTDGARYHSSRIITFDHATAQLNGAPFQSGQTVSEEGTYQLVVKSENGQITTITFTIQKAADPIEPKPDPNPLKGVSSWAAGDIQTASQLGLTKPVAEQIFSERITREQFAGVAVQLYSLITGKETAAIAENPFADTSNPAVIQAYQLGIVTGTGEQQFSPASLITREQLAVMLKRALDQTDVKLPGGAEKSFADRNTFSSYAVDAIAYMAANDVIQGMTETTFGPKDNATVEQAVIMAKRLYEKAEGGRSQPQQTPVPTQPEPQQADASSPTLAFDGAGFEVFVMEQHPQPDGTVYKKYGVRNRVEFTLAPYSAAYVATGYSDRVSFEEDYYTYRFGGYVVVSNHSGESRSFKSGEIVYDISGFYRDNMGTVEEPDGTPYTLKPNGPFMRIVRFQGEFDEAQGYKPYIDQNMVMDLGDWSRLEKAK